MKLRRRDRGIEDIIRGGMSEAEVSEAELNEGESEKPGERGSCGNCLPGKEELWDFWGRDGPVSWGQYSSITRALARLEDLMGK